MSESTSAVVSAAFAPLLGHLSVAPATIRPLLGDLVPTLTEAISAADRIDVGKDLCRSIDARIKPDQWRGVSDDKRLIQALFQWLAGVDHFNVCAYRDLDQADS